MSNEQVFYKYLIQTGGTSMGYEFDNRAMFLHY